MGGSCLASRQAAHQQVVIGCDRQAGVEAANQLKDVFADVNGWVRRHPASTQAARLELAGTPVANDLPGIFSRNINKITVHQFKAIGSPRCDSSHRVVSRKHVVGIEAADVIAGGPGETFVHGIVDAQVSFGQHVSPRLPVLPDDVKRVVAGAAVDDPVLNVRPSLGVDGAQGVDDGGCTVEADCDDAYFYWITSMYCRLASGDRANDGCLGKTIDRERAVACKTPRKFLAARQSSRNALLALASALQIRECRGVGLGRLFRGI